MSGRDEVGDEVVVKLDAEVGLHRLKHAVTKAVGLLSKIQSKMWRAVRKTCENLGRKQGLRKDILHKAVEPEVQFDEDTASKPG
jgi:hypothetical protein